MQEYFRALNQYYDKVYVLSVKPAADRRESFAKRFEGLEYSFFYGADKNSFTIEELEQQAVFNEELTRQHHRFSKTMRPGEIACAWSHRMIYEDMLAHNFARVLVFQDDAVPDPKVLSLIPTILAEIPPDCEALWWGWEKNGSAGAGGWFKKIIYHFQHRFGKLKWDHRVIRNLYAKRFSPHLKRSGFHDYTYAYGITRSAAEKLVKMQTPVQFIADNLLAHAATKEILNGYISWPPVFLHDSLPDGTHRDSYIR